MTDSGNTKRCARWREKNRQKYNSYMRKYMAKRRAAKKESS